MRFFKVKKQFGEFLKSLNPQDIGEYEIKLLNLIWNNFEEVAGCGTAGGKRGKLLFDLILKEGGTVSDQLQLPGESASTTTSSYLQRLFSLEVQSFRGFSDCCTFKLDKQFLLVYGANGSGKSSFCEAIEYCLLGDISEASHKKISLQDYIKNIDRGGAHVPTLKVVDSNGEIIEAKADYDQFHFSFIEKCRIDSFARLSSHTPASQTELLATLFGLDSFNEFVKNFTDNIENYIPIESETEKSYNLKAAEMMGHKKNKAQYEHDVELMKDREEALAKDSKLGKSFVELSLFINGFASGKGRLKEIQEELQKDAPTKIECKDVGELLLAVKNLQANQLADFEAKQQNFLEKADEVNLSSLYLALTNIDATTAKVCPACETPLSSVNKDPFINAKQKLDELKSIAELQDARNISFNKLVQTTNVLVQDIHQLSNSLKKVDLSLGLILPKEIQIATDLSRSGEYVIMLDEFLKQLIDNQVTLENAQKVIGEKNAIFFTHQNAKQELIEEQAILVGVNNRIIGLNAERSKLQELIGKINEDIISFDEANERLTEQIQSEKAQMLLNKKFISAYHTFRSKLTDYKETLPIQLVHNLNNLTAELYNEINSDDATFELLAKVVLPTRSNDVIKISFRDNPSKLHNALHVLSEGHIKCLGLSILLSKCVTSDLCILVFDDVVNAIDDDHRGKISELLFKNEHFASKQIIITSHSEEFIKDIENLMFDRDEYERLVGKIVFDRRISKKIQPFDSPFHYLKKAQSYLELSNKRDCLSNIRRCLESVTDIIWKRLINFEKSKYNVEISIKLRHPSRKPDLMNVVTGLRKFIEPLGVKKLEKINELLKWFEGVESRQPRIWEYLNKGTHEEADRDDFDNNAVRKVLEQALELEKLSKGKWVGDT
jgi:recombinational DNA repair ATPase RecF